MNKPQFIKLARYSIFLSDLRFLEDILDAYDFTAEKFIEDNGSVTLSLDQIDLIENGYDEEDAVRKLASGILEYAKDYYNEFAYWYRGNRKSHVPYVFKALVLGDAEKIGGLVSCRLGEI